MEGLGLSCYASSVDEIGESCEATSSSRSSSFSSGDRSSNVYRSEETPTSDDNVVTHLKHVKKSSDFFILIKILEIYFQRNH